MEGCGGRVPGTHDDGLPEVTLMAAGALDFEIHANAGVVGVAQVMDRQATVRWTAGRMVGDAELRRRVARLAGGVPDTAAEFMHALRTIGGHAVAGELSVSGLAPVVPPGTHGNRNDL